MINDKGVKQMGNVLYEAQFHFTSFMWIPIIIPVLFFIWPWIQDTLTKIIGMKLPIKVTFPRTACIIFGCIAAVTALIIFLFQGHMYLKTVGAYQRGQYEIVEGYVENFVPMPPGGHARESFEINGVYFEYSDYNITSGYRNTKSHGGVITGNGQYLKIGYIYYNETYGNIIVYIEELSPPEDSSS